MYCHSDIFNLFFFYPLLYFILVTIFFFKFYTYKVINILKYRLINKLLIVCFSISLNTVKVSEFREKTIANAAKYWNIYLQPLNKIFALLTQTVETLTI